MKPVEILSHSPDQTQAAAAALAPYLGPGAVLALAGDLGAGKTCFTRGLAQGMNVADPRAVSSPTFVLLQIYEGRLPIYHFDAYRIHDPGEWLDLGAEEFLFGQGVCVIEWSEKVASVLPEDRLEIQFTHAGETDRRIRLNARGANSRKSLQLAAPHMVQNAPFH